jgi:hypothetical protein
MKLIKAAFKTVHDNDNVFTLLAKGGAYGLVLGSVFVASMYTIGTTIQVSETLSKTKDEG